MVAATRASVTFPIDLPALQVRGLAASPVAVTGVLLAAVPILHVQVRGAGGRGPGAELGQVTLLIGGGAALPVLALELRRRQEGAFILTQTPLGFPHHTTHSTPSAPRTPLKHSVSHTALRASP